MLSIMMLFAEAHCLGELKWVSFREMHQSQWETVTAKERG
jgi:hypothetical protein